MKSYILKNKKPTEKGGRVLLALKINNSAHVFTNNSIADTISAMFLSILFWTKMKSLFLYDMLIHVFL